MSALVLVAPELEARLADIREAHDPAAKLGMPPHVTVLYPFASPRRLDVDTRARLAGVIGAFPRLELTFGRTERFPDVLWLAPEPEAAVAAVTAALVEAFPAYPPYRGKFPSVVPHLTVAQGPKKLLDELEPQVRWRLREPVTCRIDEVALFTTVERCWRQVDSFPLG